MSTTHDTTENVSNVPDGAGYIGIDSHGRAHHAGPRPADPNVYVETADGIETITLPVREHDTDTLIEDVEDWVDYVDDRFGWDENRYGESLVETLARNLEAA